MKTFTRTILAVLLTAVSMTAQEATSTAETVATTTAQTATAAPAERVQADNAAERARATTTAPPATTERGEQRNIRQIREEFTTMLHNQPPEVASIIALDPTLLSDSAFLARYPQLAEFVANNPEVRHNPRFYLSSFELPRERAPVQRQSAVAEIIESFGIMFVVSLIAGALAWFVRTIIEQRRWNRLSRTQAEVHNKILDRFSSSEELLAYIRTPAGTKFLESAPIPLHSEPKRQTTPLTRVMWTVQIGVVVAAAAIGMLIVSGVLTDESSQGLFALGMIGLCLGVGFVASAAVSLFLSRRLGLWEQQDSLAPAASDRVDEPGFVK